MERRYLIKDETGRTIETPDEMFHRVALNLAKAEAKWDGQKLVIEEKANPRCGDGKTYARNTVNCEIGQDGQAKCTGSQPGDSRSYNVQFGR